jgi:adenine-specific DNA-methyltransferase
MHRAVDWGKLRSLLGEYVEDGEPEKYDFTWVGKRAAQREAAAPCRKTLRPCPEESVDWDTTQNLYIEGDNLEVLKLLQNSYMGKVKMIYIDPPYNTGNDFVYHDDFAQSAEEYDEHNRDEEGNRFRKNTDSNGRFHSDWCSMIYTRLMVARSLLTEDGVIFISIDDNEQRNLKNICDEVFGERNFEGHIHWRRRHNQPNDKTKMIGIVAEHIIVYAKNSPYLKQVGVGKLDVTANFTNPDNDPKGPWASKPWKVGSDQSGSSYTIVSPTGKILEGEWMGEEKTYRQFLAEGRIYFPKGGDGFPRKKYYAFEREEEGQCATNWWTHEQFGHNQGANDYATSLFGRKNVFSNPKPLELLRGLIKIGNVKNDDVMLDFFSGSATSADSILRLNAEDGGNRKFIMVQLPEETAEDSEAYKAGYKNICEIGKERIRRAGKKIKEEHPEANALDIGFRVLKCDESNYKPVAFAPKDYTQESLDMFLDNIKEERTGLDLLFDCMMRWGLELSLPYETQKVDDCTIYNVDDGSLVACFDGVVTSAVIDAIAETHPLRVVFRDSSFTEAAQKMNLFELFKQKCGWTDQEVQNNVRVI